MAKSRVTISEVDVKAERLMELNTTLRSQIVLVKDSEVTLAESWEGNASDSFDTEFKLYIEKMEYFSKLVNRYIEILKELIGIYLDDETEPMTMTKRTYN